MYFRSPALLRLAFAWVSLARCRVCWFDASYIGTWIFCVVVKLKRNEGMMIWYKYIDEGVWIDKCQELVKDFKCRLP